LEKNPKTESIWTMGGGKTSGGMSDLIADFQKGVGIHWIVGRPLKNEGGFKRMDKARDNREGPPREEKRKSGAHYGGKSQCDEEGGTKKG